MSEEKQFLSLLAPGQVVEFLEDSKPQIALVLEKKDSRLRVLLPSNREKKISQSRILPWIGPVIALSTSREELVQKLELFKIEREKLFLTINVEEIWELVHSEVEKIDIDWLADIYFVSPDIHQKSALGRALLTNRILFKYRPPFFEIHSPEQVEHLREEQKKKALQARIVNEGRELLKEALKGPNRVKLENYEEDFVKGLKDILLAVLGKRADAKQEKLFRQLTQGLPKDDFLAYILALNLGFIPNHFNYHLIQAGYDFYPSWNAFQKEIDQLKEKSKTWPAKASLKGFVSIDSKTTKDIDDAFKIEIRDNRIFLKIAISCPILNWEFGSKLDLKVRERFSSLYLPEGTSHMLPEEIGINLYSLEQGKVRPALVFNFEFDNLKELENFSLDFAWIETEKNISYEEADIFIQEKQEYWKQLFELAKNLREKRILNGAVIIEQLEPQIILKQNNEDILVEMLFKDKLCLSQMVISELMILCNLWAGKWAKKYDIPLYFRSQKINLSKDNAGVWHRPEEIYTLVKNMAPSLLEVEPGWHASLGVEVYAGVSSPLRRYPDFVNVAQIMAFLQKKDLLFSKQDLQNLLSYLTSRQSLVSQVQRFRPRYWKLLYFKQRHKKEEFEGVLVDKGNPLSVFSLPKEQVLVRVPTSLLEDKTPVGEKCLLTFGKVDPLRNEIKVIKVRKKN